MVVDDSSVNARDQVEAALRASLSVFRVLPDVVSVVDPVGLLSFNVDGALQVLMTVNQYLALWLIRCVMLKVVCGPTVGAC